MPAEQTAVARINSIRAKLAQLTGGSLFGVTAVKLDGSEHDLRIMVDQTGITFSVANGFEYLPKGLTFRQIADHALAVANGRPEPLGEVITNRDYGRVMGS